MHDPFLALRHVVTYGLDGSANVKILTQTAALAEYEASRDNWIYAVAFVGVRSRRGQGSVRRRGEIMGRSVGH